MHLSLSRNVRRLPKRFPVGTTYVVEGHGGKDGHLRVFSRYVVLPNGQRINLDADMAGAPAFRARRARSRQAALAAGAQNSARSGGKRGRARSKKISANGGTPRRHRR